MAVFFGMGCSFGVGCFVRRFVLLRFVDLVLYSVWFEIGVLLGYGVLFGVSFAEKMFCLFSQVWAEQCSCSLNVVRVQS